MKIEKKIRGRKPLPDLGLLKNAPTQMDWLSVRFRKKFSGLLDFRDVISIISKILEIPLEHKFLTSTKTVAFSKDAGVYISVDCESLEIQFQGTFFAFSESPLPDLRLKLRSISKELGVPFYFTRLDLSRDFFGFEINALTKNFLNPASPSNLGTPSAIFGKKTSELETLQFSTEKRTVQFYRKDLELHSKKSGTDYFEEYSARHQKQTGKKVGEQPWTRMELRIKDSSTLTPFLKWFCDDHVEYPELLTKSLGHFFSKLYVKLPSKDSNFRRRKDCPVFLAMTLKDKNSKWPQVFGAIKKRDLRFSNIENNWQKRLETTVKSCLKRNVEIDLSKEKIIQIGLAEFEKYKELESTSPLYRYAETYRLLLEMQASSQKFEENRDGQIQLVAIVKSNADEFGFKNNFGNDAA